MEWGTLLGPRIPMDHTSPLPPLSAHPQLTEQRCCQTCCRRPWRAAPQSRCPASRRSARPHRSIPGGTRPRGAVGSHLPPLPPSGGLTAWRYLRAQQLAPIRGEVEADAIEGAGQRGPTDDEDEEDQVGEGGRDVHHLHRAQLSPALLAQHPQPCPPPLTLPELWMPPSMHRKTTIQAASRHSASSHCTEPGSPRPELCVIPSTCSLRCGDGSQWDGDAESLSPHAVGPGGKEPACFRQLTSRKPHWHWYG